MGFPVDFFYDREAGICLRLNTTLKNSIDTLNQICSTLKPVNGKISIDGKEVDWETGKYEYLARTNIDWIKSKFQVYDDFINWWKFCIEKQLIEFISNNVHDTYINGFTIEYDEIYNNYNIKLPVKLTDEEFYKTFLMFNNNICGCCWFYWCGDGREHLQCKNAILKSLYDLKNVEADIGCLYVICGEQQDTTNELFASQQATQAQLDKFEKFHRNEYAHMRTDFESCATLINKNTEKQKTYCEETNLYVNDLQDRISRLESLMCENVDSQIIDRILNINKESESLEQIVKKQQQTIDELQAELKKQREEFEEYKSQRQQQLAAIMSQM